MIDCAAPGLSTRMTRVAVAGGAAIVLAGGFGAALDAARQLPKCVVAHAVASARVTSPVTMSVARRGSAARSHKLRTAEESNVATVAESPPRSVWYGCDA